MHELLSFQGSLIEPNSIHSEREAKRLEREKTIRTPEEIERIIMEQLTNELRNT
jgi:hypothetical protein